MSSWMNGIGSLHLVAVHVPIGAIMLTFLLDAYVRRRPATTARDCVRLALWVCLATAAVTALLGVLRVMSGSYDMTWVIRHGLGALVTIVFLGGTLVLGRGLVTQRWSSSRARLYAVSFVAVLGAVAFTGHVGGVLAHGLPFVPWLAESRPAVDGSGGHAALRVLEQRCSGCHGGEQPESGLRMDDRPTLLAGGYSGKPAVTPGQPQASEMIRRLLLPEGSADTMPPAGQARPTADEILTIAHWIANGAPFPEPPAR